MENPMRSETEKARPGRPLAMLETVLYVDDLDAAFDFYASVMKLPLRHRDGRMGVFHVSGRSFLLLFRSGGTLEPIELPGGTIPAHDGKAGMHVAFSVDPRDMDAWASRLERRGIPIESTMTWPTGDKSLYFRDPAGNLIELATPDLWGAGGSDASRAGGGHDVPG